MCCTSLSSIYLRIWMVAHSTHNIIIMCTRVRKLRAHINALAHEHTHAFVGTIRFIASIFIFHFKMLCKYLNSFELQRICGVFGNLQFSENVIYQGAIERGSSDDDDKILREKRWNEMKNSQQHPNFRQRPTLWYNIHRKLYSVIMKKRNSSSQHITHLEWMIKKY